MEEILFLTVFLGIILMVLILPKWIKKCQQVGLLWEDMNKYNHPKNVAASGGVVVVMAFVISVLLYIAVRTFVFGEDNQITTKIFSVLSVISILAIVGLTDDLLGWKHEGLSKRMRIFLAICSSIPLIVINAGAHNINLPFLGNVSNNLFYLLFLIPLGIAGATTTFNFLAGFNGLEAGQGIIILSFLSFIAYITGSPWIALIGLIMVASLAVFYYYNKFPAKVFPGDILTYSIGALIACMAILGNFEKIALFVFSPYILEVILKVRGRLKKHSFGIPNKDGSLEMPYDKVYGMTHFSIFILKKIKQKVYERDVVYFIFAIQIVICLLALLIFRNSLFV
jgi:UDP-N-acetylglucosamine--dolichyl-phosphate N-acetylglucosaminephosphotransferase